MNVVITGGGTAGHINPGLAIAKNIIDRYPKANILFVGTERGLEKDLVPREGFKLEFIKSKGLKRKLSLDSLTTAKEMFEGYFQAKKILKNFKADIVIGTGGYVCVPVIAAAKRLKISTIIHESNAFPGLANKILGRIVNVAAVTYKETEKYFKHTKKVVFTGNPVRKEIIEAARQDKNKNQEEPAPVVLVFGGSRGAQRINEAIIEIIEINNGRLPYTLNWATGQTQYDIVIKKLNDKKIDIGKQKNIKIVPYLFNMAKDMVEASVIVGRAGAISTSEITAVGIPSILIPYPYATENHQEHNARALETQDAAIVLLEKDLTGQMLNQQINNLINNKEKLVQMSKNAKKMGVFDAAEKIVTIAEELMK